LAKMGQMARIYSPDVPPIDYRVYTI